MDEIKNFFMLLILGSVSCSAPVPLVNPLEVVKTRLQLTTQSSSIIETTKQIVKNEGGWRALYKGVVPAILRESSYAAMRLALYDPFKRMLGEHRTGFLTDAAEPETASEELSLARKLLAGSAAGAVGAALANPTDVLKVRLQADPTGTLYNGSALQGFRTVYRTEGLWKGLYRGTLPTAARAALLSAAFLPSYDQAKVVIKRQFGVADSAALHVVCGLFAGFCMTVVSCPVDVIKTRYVVGSSSNCTGTGSRQVQSGLIQCIVSTAKESGIRSFYRGFLPTFSRLGPHSLLAMAINEKLRKLCGVPPV